MSEAVAASKTLLPVASPLDPTAPFVAAVAVKIGRNDLYLFASVLVVAAVVLSLLFLQ